MLRRRVARRRGRPRYAALHPTDSVIVSKDERVVAWAHPRVGIFYRSKGRERRTGLSCRRDKMPVPGPDVVAVEELFHAKADQGHQSRNHAMKTKLGITPRRQDAKTPRIQAFPTEPGGNPAVAAWEFSHAKGEQGRPRRREPVSGARDWIPPFGETTLRRSLPPLDGLGPAWREIIPRPLLHGYGLDARGSRSMVAIPRHTRTLNQSPPRLTRMRACGAPHRLLSIAPDTCLQRPMQAGRPQIPQARTPALRGPHLRSGRLRPRSTRSRGMADVTHS